MAGEWEIAERLEMLLVLQWLDEDRPADGCVVLSIATAAAELDLDDDEGLLEVMPPGETEWGTVCQGADDGFGRKRAGVDLPRDFGGGERMGRRHDCTSNSKKCAASIMAHFVLRLPEHRRFPC